MPPLPEDRYALTKFFNLVFRFDVKRIVDSGQAQMWMDDPEGTYVAFNRLFKDIDSITASVRETTDFNVVINFVDAPSPTGFRALVFDSDGLRVDKIIFWIARGVQ